MALSWIELPDGYTFALENLKAVSVVGLALRLDNTNGTFYDWPSNGADYAAQLKSQIKAIQTTPANYTTINQAFITSITPASITFASTMITVKGYGFKASTIGKIYFEDKVGGTDSNGPNMVCTFVDSNTVTAVRLSDGDGEYDASMMAYYQDSNGVKSNSLNCSSTITGIIVMA